MTAIDIETVILRIARALDTVGAAYFLGGSMASSLQGEPRSTNDLDFVVELREDQVDPLARALGDDFDVDTLSLLDAVQTRTSWNIYFLPTALKIDLFIRRSSPFDDAEFRRRREVELRPNERVAIKSAEDTVLRKLLWFRAGGEVSTTQWRDVVEVLRVSGSTLEREYLADWARQLGVGDLLARAEAEALSERAP